MSPTSACAQCPKKIDVGRLPHSVYCLAGQRYIPVPPTSAWYTPRWCPEFDTRVLPFLQGIAERTRDVVLALIERIYPWAAPHPVDMFMLRCGNNWPAIRLEVSDFSIAFFQPSWGGYVGLSVAAYTPGEELWHQERVLTKNGKLRASAWVVIQQQVVRASTIKTKDVLEELALDAIEFDNQGEE